MKLSKLKSVLEKKYGDDWSDLEIETISMDLGAAFDMLTIAQFAILKTLKDDEFIIANDADYFNRFIEVANGYTPDPHYHDIPNSLELAFALTEWEKLTGSLPKTKCVKLMSGYILDNEGHGHAYHDCLSSVSGRSMLNDDKTEACNRYLAHMDEA